MVSKIVEVCMTDSTFVSRRFAFVPSLVASQPIAGTALLALALFVTLTIIETLSVATGYAQSAAIVAADTTTTQESGFSRLTNDSGIDNRPARSSNPESIANEPHAIQIVDTQNRYKPHIAIGLTANNLN
jgi:hypothetical protein